MRLAVPDRRPNRRDHREHHGLGLRPAVPADRLPDPLALAVPAPDAGAHQRRAVLRRRAVLPHECHGLLLQWD
jgi:hypothetical protein